MAGRHPPRWFRRAKGCYPRMTMTLLMLALAAMTLAPAPDPASIEREARQIEGQLIAPCCWTQPVSQHQSQASDEVKKQIRVLLTAGKTRQEVLDAFAAQYGARILAEPPAAGVGRLLYVGLPLAFLLSAAALVIFVKRASASKPPPGPAPGTTAPDEAGYSARLDEELRDLD